MQHAKPFSDGLGVLHFQLIYMAEERIVAFQFQRLGISRDVLVFAQWVVQQVEVLDSAFGHQVEEVLLNDGDIVG